MMLEQQEWLQQEILQLCYLAAASTNSIVKYGECQEALSKKKFQLLEVERHITRSLFTALNKTATNYPQLEEYEEEE
jgi:hypothetical protein